jgi:glycosyltransferase involved in cell wall biosynthesis
VNPGVSATVGIVIPTFNRREYLRLALESVLAQTHEDLEVLVMDNGSTDGTPKAMASVRDPRVRYVVNPRNLGMAGSINAGMRLLSDRVSWCTVLADDDLLDPGFVRCALERAAESGAASVVDGHRVFVDPAGARLRDAVAAPLEQPALDYAEARAPLGLRETYLTGVLFHRRAFDAVGGYPTFTTGLATDDALIFALALRDRLVHAPAAISRVRLHPEAESLSPQGALDKLTSMDEFCDFCVRTLEAHGPSPEERARLERALQVHRSRIKIFLFKTVYRRVRDRSDGYSRAHLPRLFDFVRRRPQDFTPKIRLRGTLFRLGVL